MCGEITLIFGGEKKHLDMTTGERNEVEDIGIDIDPISLHTGMRIRFVLQLFSHHDTFFFS